MSVRSTHTLSQSELVTKLAAILAVSEPETVANLANILIPNSGITYDDSDGTFTQVLFYEDPIVELFQDL